MVCYVIEGLNEIEYLTNFIKGNWKSFYHANFPFSLSNMAFTRFSETLMYPYIFRSFLLGLEKSQNKEFSYIIKFSIFQFSIFNFQIFKFSNIKFQLSNL